MTMGDRIHPGHKKYTDPSGEAAESTNPSDGWGAQEPSASAERHEPHIEPAPLEDAPGS
jgi:hypothetical protein